MSDHEEQKMSVLQKWIKPLNILNRLKPSSSKSVVSKENVSRQEAIDDLRLNPNENMDRYNYLFDLSQEDFDKAHARLHEIRFHDTTRTYDIHTKIVRGFISDVLEKELLHLNSEDFDKILLRLDQVIAANVAEHFSDDNKRYLLGLNTDNGKITVRAEDVLNDPKLIAPLQSIEPEKRNDWLNNYRKSVKK